MLSVRVAFDDGGGRTGGASSTGGSGSGAARADIVHSFNASLLVSAAASRPHAALADASLRSLMASTSRRVHTAEAWRPHSADVQLGRLIRSAHMLGRSALEGFVLCIRERSAWDAAGDVYAFLRPAEGENVLTLLRLLRAARPNALFELTFQRPPPLARALDAKALRLGPRCIRPVNPGLEQRAALRAALEHDQAHAVMCSFADVMLPQGGTWSERWLVLTAEHLTIYSLQSMKGEPAYSRDTAQLLRPAARIALSDEVAYSVIGTREWQLCSSGFVYTLRSPGTSEMLTWMAALRRCDARMSDNALLSVPDAWMGGDALFRAMYDAMLVNALQTVHDVLHVSALRDRLQLYARRVGHEALLLFWTHARAYELAHPLTPLLAPWLLLSTDTRRAAWEARSSTVDTELTQAAGSSRRQRRRSMHAGEAADGTDTRSKSQPRRPGPERDVPRATAARAVSAARARNGVPPPPPPRTRHASATDGSRRPESRSPSPTANVARDVAAELESMRPAPGRRLKASLQSSPLHRADSGSVSKAAAPRWSLDLNADAETKPRRSSARPVASDVGRDRAGSQATSVLLRPRLDTYSAYCTPADARSAMAQARCIFERFVLPEATSSIAAPHDIGRSIAQHVEADCSAFVGAVRRPSVGTQSFAPGSGSAAPASSSSAGHIRRSSLSKPVSTTAAAVSTVRSHAMQHVPHPELFHELLLLVEDEIERNVFRPFCEEYVRHMLTARSADRVATEAAQQTRAKPGFVSMLARSSVAQQRSRSATRAPRSSMAQASAIVAARRATLAAQMASGVDSAGPVPGAGEWVAPRSTSMLPSTSDGFSFLASGGSFSVPSAARGSPRLGSVSADVDDGARRSSLLAREGAHSTNDGTVIHYLATSPDAAYELNVSALSMLPPATAVTFSVVQSALQPWLRATHTSCLQQATDSRMSRPSSSTSLASMLAPTRGTSSGVRSASVAAAPIPAHRRGSSLTRRESAAGADSSSSRTALAATRLSIGSTSHTLSRAVSRSTSFSSVGGHARGAGAGSHVSSAAEHAGMEAVSLPSHSHVLSTLHLIAPVMVRIWRGKWDRVRKTRRAFNSEAVLHRLGASEVSATSSTTRSRHAQQEREHVFIPTTSRTVSVAARTGITSTRTSVSDECGLGQADAAADAHWISATSYASGVDIDQEVLVSLMHKYRVPVVDVAPYAALAWRAAAAVNVPLPPTPDGGWGLTAAAASAHARGRGADPDDAAAGTWISLWLNKATHGSDTAAQHAPPVARDESAMRVIRWQMQDAAAQALLITSELDMLATLEYMTALLAIVTATAPPPPPTKRTKRGAAAASEVGNVTKTAVRPMPAPVVVTTAAPSVPSTSQTVLPRRVAAPSVESPPPAVTSPPAPVPATPTVEEVAALPTSDFLLRIPAFSVSDAESHTGTVDDLSVTAPPVSNWVAGKHVIGSNIRRLVAVFDHHDAEATTLRAQGSESVQVRASASASMEDASSPPLLPQAPVDVATTKPLSPGAVALLPPAAAHDASDRVLTSRKSFAVHTRASNTSASPARGSPVAPTAQSKPKKAQRKAAAASASYAPTSSLSDADYLRWFGTSRLPAVDASLHARVQDAVACVSTAASLQTGPPRSMAHSLEVADPVSLRYMRSVMEWSCVDVDDMLCVDVESGDAACRASVALQATLRSVLEPPAAPVSERRVAPAETRPGAFESTPTSRAAAPHVVATLASAPKQLFGAPLPRRRSFVTRDMLRDFSSSESGTDAVVVREDSMSDVHARATAAATAAAAVAAAEAAAAAAIVSPAIPPMIVSTPLSSIKERSRDAASLFDSPSRAMRRVRTAFETVRALATMRRAGPQRAAQANEFDPLIGLALVRPPHLRLPGDGVLSKWRKRRSNARTRMDTRAVTHARGAEPVMMIRLAHLRDLFHRSGSGRPSIATAPRLPAAPAAHVAKLGAAIPPVAHTVPAAAVPTSARVTTVTIPAPARGTARPAGYGGYASATTNGSMVTAGAGNSPALGASALPPTLPTQLVLADTPSPLVDDSAGDNRRHRVLHLMQLKGEDAGSTRTLAPHVAAPAAPAIRLDAPPLLPLAVLHSGWVHIGWRNAVEGVSLGVLVAAANAPSRGAATTQLPAVSGMGGGLRRVTYEPQHTYHEAATHFDVDFDESLVSLVNNVEQHAAALAATPHAGSSTSESDGVMPAAGVSGMAASNRSSFIGSTLSLLPKLDVAPPAASSANADIAMFGTEMVIERRSRGARASMMLFVTSSAPAPAAPPVTTIRPPASLSAASSMTAVASSSATTTTTAAMRPGRGLRGGTRRTSVDLGAGGSIEATLVASPSPSPSPSVPSSRRSSLDGGSALAATAAAGNDHASSKLAEETTRGWMRVYAVLYSDGSLCFSPRQVDAGAASAAAYITRVSGHERMHTPPVFSIGALNLSSALDASPARDVHVSSHAIEIITRFGYLLFTPTLAHGSRAWLQAFNTVMTEPVYEYDASPLDVGMHDRSAFHGSVRRAASRHGFVRDEGSTQDRSPLAAINRAISLGGASTGRAVALHSGLLQKRGWLNRRWQERQFRLSIAFNTKKVMVGNVGGVVRTAFGAASKAITATTIAASDAPSEATRVAAMRRRRSTIAMLTMSGRDDAAAAAAAAAGGTLNDIAAQSSADVHRALRAWAAMVATILAPGYADTYMLPALVGAAPSSVVTALIPLLQLTCAGNRSPIHPDVMAQMNESLPVAVRMLIRGRGSKVSSPSETVAPTPRPTIAASIAGSGASLTARSGAPSKLLQDVSADATPSSIWRSKSAAGAAPAGMKVPSSLFAPDTSTASDAAGSLPVSYHIPALDVCVGYAKTTSLLTAALSGSGENIRGIIQLLSHGSWKAQRARARFITLPSDMPTSMTVNAAGAEEAEDAPASPPMAEGTTPVTPASAVATGTPTSSGGTMASIKRFFSFGRTSSTSAGAAASPTAGTGTPPAPTSKNTPVSPAVTSPPVVGTASAPRGGPGQPSTEFEVTTADRTYDLGCEDALIAAEWLMYIRMFAPPRLESWKRRIADFNGRTYVSISNPGSTGEEDAAAEAYVIPSTWLTLVKRNALSVHGDAGSAATVTPT